MLNTWWRYQMETFSALLALCEGNPPITRGFPSQRPMTPSFDVFFDLRLNKQLSKQSRRQWFERPSRSLWRHSNANVTCNCNRTIYYHCGLHALFTITNDTGTSKLWMAGLLIVSPVASIISSSDLKAFHTTHYSDVIMSSMRSKITGAPIVCSTVSSGADQRKHKSSTWLVFVRGIHRWPVDSPHKETVTLILFPFDDVTMLFPGLLPVAIV